MKYEKTKKEPVPVHIVTDAVIAANLEAPQTRLISSSPKK
jgi:hypothetical protein